MTSVAGANAHVGVAYVMTSIGGWGAHTGADCVMTSITAHAPTWAWRAW